MSTNPNEVDVQIQEQPIPLPVTTGPKVVKTRRLVLQRLFEEWMEVKNAGLADSSKMLYRMHANRFFKFMRKHKISLPELSHHHVSKYMNGQHELGRNATTISTTISILRWCVQYWIDDGRLMIRNPFALSHLPKFPRRRIERKPLTYQQYQLLLAATARTGGRRIYREWMAPTLTIGWHTGLRISDVAHLQWKGECSEVNFEEQYINVFTRKLRRFGQKIQIPMENELYDVLWKLWEEKQKSGMLSPFCLPMLHGTFISHRQAVTMYLHETFVNAGLGDYSFHCFRHGLVTRLLDAGVETIIVQQITGQSRDIVEQYAHIGLETKRNALELARAAMHKAEVRRVFHKEGQITVL